MKRCIFEPASSLLILAIFVAVIFIVGASRSASALQIEQNTIAATDEGCAISYSAQEYEDQFSLYGIEYFAYMELDTAPTEIHPFILEARSRIIYDSDIGWVADDMDGCIKDKDGNIIEILPHFHDIFPDDWELPPRYVVTNNE